jgi:hypothetical protein
MATYTLIASTTVGAGGASYAEFTSIPATYTDLLVKLSSRTNSGDPAEALTLTINSSNGTCRYLYSVNGSVGSGSDTVIYGGNSTGAGATSNIFSNGEFYIPNYTVSRYKPVGIHYASENNNATNFTQLINAGLWSNNSAITSLRLTPSAGNTIQQYSSFYLYGISNA